MAGRTTAPLPRTYPDHPSGIARFSRTSPKYRYETGGYVDHSVTLVGATVLMEHFLAAAAILSNTAIPMLNLVGDMGVEEARRLVPYDTGATHDSIVVIGGSAKQGMLTRSAEHQWAVEVGVQTFYAPFLEWGTVKMSPRPFMMPAAGLMEATLVASVKAILTAVLGGEGASGTGGASGGAGRIMGSPEIQGQFTQFRSFLYSSAKALGDLSVFGGRATFGPIRASMYNLAKLLGDVDALVGGAVGQRVVNRLRGRVQGRLVGVGSASLSFEKMYSAFPGGALGHRAYQRIAGAHMKSFGATLNNIMGR